MSLHGLPYEQTKPAADDVPAIPWAVNRVGTAGLAIPSSPGARAGVHDQATGSRDSGNVSSSPLDSKTSVNTEPKSASSLTSAPDVPQIRFDQDDHPSTSGPARDKSWLLRKSGKIKMESSNTTQATFMPLTLNLPSGGLSDELPTGNMEFSKHGSMLIGGHKVVETQSTPVKSRSAARRIKSNPSMRARAATKILSTDEEMLSQKVRSFYDVGAELPADGDADSSLGRQIGLRWQDALGNHEGRSVESVSRATSTSDLRSITSGTPRTPSFRKTSLIREDHELAGGLEDWENVANEDVDRYGFIMPKTPATDTPTKGGITRSPSSMTRPGMQRMATSLQVASDQPRRKNTVKRSPSNARDSATSTGARTTTTTRPMSSQSAYTGSLGRSNSRLRTATNKLPHNKGRKLLDEAGDMLTLPPQLASISEGGAMTAADLRARNKETEREEKWRRMARVVSNGSKGSGMIFDFDTKSSKVMERTWKGIPDRWRATAWYAFLSASAKKRKDCSSDNELFAAYHEYLEQASPDDVQIDIDVPRTISSHIMFRKRYRGGQRLLFHVLHAMSLHFPDTGYVQGMAALAATLLAYYEEEKAFVMLVRLWDLRGLDKLYQSGFEGLMGALDDFEKRWLGEGELAAKLVRSAQMNHEYGQH